MTQATTPAVRFWAKVDRPNGPLDPGPCWLWTARHARDGYGTFKVNGRQVLAHRWAYEWFYDEIDNTLVLDHICRVRDCVNPWHLREVTTTANTLENSESITARYAARTVCSKGHPLDGTVTIKGKTWRRCTACLRAAQRRYEEKRKRGH